MKFEIKAKVELRDKNGKIVKTIHKKLNSYIINLIDMLQGLFSAVDVNTKVTMTDTGSTSRSWYFPVCVNATGAYFELLANAGAGDDNFGIQVGSDNPTILITDVKLSVKIVHGSASTKLSYGACSVGVCATVGSTRQFTIARTFTNASGADITVKEIGLILKSFYSVVTVGYFLIEHSLLQFTISNGLSGTVTYTISTTV